MRKLTILLLSVCVFFSFGLLMACGSSGGGSDDEDTGTTTGGSGGGTASAPWLCFKAVGGSVDVKLKLESASGVMSSVPSLEYSADGSTWNSIALSNPAGTGTSTTNDITTLADGSKMYLRAINTNNFITEYNPGTATMVSAIFLFSGAGNVEASGNIMSLVDKTCASTVIPSDGCFMQLFNDCTKLVSSPELPAATLTQGCYSRMFDGCTALTTAPELPATTLATGCYISMFEGCSSLTAGPEIKATALATMSCVDMFRSCSSITSLKVNFGAWSSGATENWVKDVAATGTFTCPSGLDVSSPGDSKNPSGWTVVPF